MKYWVLPAFSCIISINSTMLVKLKFFLNQSLFRRNWLLTDHRIVMSLIRLCSRVILMFIRSTYNKKKVTNPFKLT